MEALIKFSVPLYLVRGKKKPKNYWLNLNSYRNWKYHLNNDLKIQFKKAIHSTLAELDPIQGPIKIVYTFYYPDSRRRDLGNSLAVISKFTEDALVEEGIIPDDDYTIIRSIAGRYGGYDKQNPRCEVAIKEVI